MLLLLLAEISGSTPQGQLPGSAVCLEAQTGQVERLPTVSDAPAFVPGTSAVGAPLQSGHMDKVFGHHGGF